MKCPECGALSNYKERDAAGGACTSCRKPFVFEPRKGDPVTDLMFANAIRVLSEDGALAWLDRQLYYEVARRIRKRRVLHRMFRRPCVILSEEAFDRLLRRWLAVKGEPPRRLRPGAYAVDARAGERARDAGDYAFERLVVCDNDAIVDVLLANGFHADHKSAVLSARRYPMWAADLLLPALRATPPAAVLVLHAADHEGCRLAETVRTDPRWFGGVEVDVVDAGLRAADARRFRGVYLRGTPVNVLAQGVSVDEAKWLSRYRLELEAARPRALLSVLAGMVVHEEAGEPGPVSGWWGMPGWGDGGDDDVG